jgi:glutathione S-transferase
MEKTMQEIDLETVVSPVYSAGKKQGLQLVIGDKHLSSWSMRPWLVLKAAGIPFTEIKVALAQPDTTAKIAEYSLAGRVPVLLDEDRTIWDSLAICEYLAEQYPALELWPIAPEARAHARSICAEMHSGFSALRGAMPFHIGAHLPGQGRTPAAQADIGRISEIWEDCLSRYGAHAYLFGDFSIADAYYAPVVMRFVTYGVSLAPALQAYADRIVAHPAVAAWIQQALAEKTA